MANQQSYDDRVRNVIYLTYDRLNSNTISEELAKAGYRIRVTYGLGEALLCLRQTPFDVVIVGHLISARDRSLLASEVRRSNGRTKIIFLYLESLRNADDADAVLSLEGGVASLAEALKDLLSSEQ